jgi:hypothetical protein
MANQDENVRQASAHQSGEASVAALRAFVEARNAYFTQLIEGWQAGQRELKDTGSADAKACEALMKEYQQSISDAGLRYGEALRGLSQDSQDARGAAMECSTRYQTELSLAQIASGQKWIEQRRHTSTSMRRLQQAHSERAKDTYRNFLTALKSAWQSVDPGQLTATQVQYINQLVGDVNWHASRNAGCS